MSVSPRLSRLAVVLLLVSIAEDPVTAVVPLPLPQAGAVRILGPRDETTPVVNENNQLQLHVEGGGSVSRWTSDSPEVATITNTGQLMGKRYGFATISAETNTGTAQVIAVVARRTRKRASKAQGDTKTDTGGNVYLSSPRQHVIYKASGLAAEVLAGTVGQAGYADGTGSQARFDVPTGLGVDQSARGGVYVADTENHCIRRIGPNGAVKALVGLPQQAGRMMADRTPMDQAMLDGPRGVAVVGGNLMVADTENDCIWYVDLERQEVRIVAGEPGIAGLENGRGRAARFDHPSGLAVSTDGRLVAVADTGNNVVRLISVGKEGGKAVYDVTTLGLGSSKRGAEVAKALVLDDPADAIGFDAPESVSIDSVGNVYVVDAASASVVTRRESGVELVDLAQFGTLGHPASVTLAGTQAFVLDGEAATDEEAVDVVEVGPPTIDAVSAGEVRLEGGEQVVVDGSNFAPESVLTFGDAVVADYEVESARRIRFVAPAVEAPGVRTLTVATRGGLGQRALEVRASPLSELAVGEVTTVAGGVPYIGDGGAASAAGLSRPSSVAVDAAGNAYIADTGNHRIRRVDATGRITTVAGTGVAGYDGDDKPATSARIYSPGGVAVDAAGNLYIADSYNYRIRRVDATGRITTVAGTGEYGYDGDDKPATSARLSVPHSVAVDASGNLYIADNNRIRRVDATGRITTVAGTGEYGYDGDDKPATLARINYPLGVAVDPAGNVFIADSANHRLRRVDATGLITTVAGTGEAGYDSDNEPATSARINYPEGVAVDPAGNLYIADAGNNRIRRVDATGRITTIAGTGEFGYDGDDKPATAARLYSPSGVTVDAAGNAYIADIGNHRIRRVDATGRIETAAGTGDASYDGDDKPATLARLNNPAGVAVDALGNIYIADANNDRVRRVDATGLITTVAGTGKLGYDGDDKPAASARVFYPEGVAVDAAGNLYIADRGNERIRRVDATGRITTIAGTGVRGYDGDDKPATSAQLNDPLGVAVDASGNVYVADTFNNRIRRVDATGLITTIAGTGEAGYYGDEGPAISARVDRPYGIALDGSGNVFVADTFNHRIRRIDAAGLITTVAGTGEVGDDGDDNPATSARLGFPHGVAVDASGSLYIADFDRVRRVDAGGRITTVAGTGEAGYDGDDKPATAARIYGAGGLAVDASGNVYIADSLNDAIRVVKGPLPAGDPVDRPRIDSASFRSARHKLKIAGANFGTSGAIVLANGADASARIRKQTDGKIVLRGSAAELGLQAGANEITVTVGGRTSAVYVLNL